MKHRKTVWQSCVVMLCLWAGWLALVGPNGIRPRPRAAWPCVQGAGYKVQGEPYSHEAQRADAGAAPARKPAVSYAKLPLSFEANQGQADKRVKFLARGPGGASAEAGFAVPIETVIGLAKGSGAALPVLSLTTSRDRNACLME